LKESDMLDMPNAEKMENVIRLYKAILTQAIVDALYDPTKKDLKAEEKFKTRVKKHGYFTQKGKPITLKNKVGDKRYALEWLYTDDDEMLQLCCSLSNLSLDRVRSTIEDIHKKREEKKDERQNKSRAL